MKYAQSNIGQPVIASAQAPAQACCPHCRGTLHLRSRRTMTQGRVYYWRHRRNRNRQCPGRTRGIRVTTAHA